jgi:hypothetical protein
VQRVVTVTVPVVSIRIDDQSVGESNPHEAEVMAGDATRVLHAGPLIAIADADPAVVANSAAAAAKVRIPRFTSSPPADLPKTVREPIQSTGGHATVNPVSELDSGPASTTSPAARASPSRCCSAASASRS